MSYISIYYLTISAYFCKWILRSVCNVVGDNFRLGYGAQISDTGVFANHTFNVWGKFNMCQTLTSISTYYLTITAYFFLRDIYTMYMI